MVPKLPRKPNGLKALGFKGLGGLLALELSLKLLSLLENCEES